MKTIQILALSLAFSSAAQAKDSLCLIAGLLGGTDYSNNVLRAEMAAVDVPLVSFSSTKIGGLVERSEVVLSQFQEALKQDPELRCHFVGHSMGGLIMRYMTNHLEVRHPTKGFLPVSDFALSQTTLATPHKGTPLTKFVTKLKLELGMGIEDLSEKSTARLDNANSALFSPALPGVPAYSYLSYIEDESEAQEFVDRVGFQIMSVQLLLMGRDNLNDGLVPTASQPFGKVLATMHVPHRYFSTDSKGTRWPSLVEFYKAHWSIVK